MGQARCMFDGSVDAQQTPRTIDRDEIGIAGRDKIRSPYHARTAAEVGRGGGIRTHDLVLPKHVR